MEKPAAKSKIKLLKFLPRAASAIKFQNLPFSPGRKKKADTNANKHKNSYLDHGFSGPILSIIPAEAKQKPKCSSFRAQEPTSPKVSCMGQIKHRKKLAKEKLFLMPNDIINPYSSPFGSQLKSSVMKPVFFLPEAKKKPSNVRNSNVCSAKPGRKSDASAYKCKPIDRAPSLSQMKRFASCRDWTKAQIASDHDLDEWRCYSDEERGDSEGEEEEGVVPFFAPILVGEGGTLAVEPRKEINLWKRRTIAQPKPLEINTFVTIHR